MVDAGSLRDSTQIVLPREVIQGVRDEVEREFVVTIVDEGDAVRIVGSPVVIREVTDFLCRRGVSVP